MSLWLSGENQVGGERSEGEKKRKLSSLHLLPRCPCYGACQGLRLPNWSSQDNRGLTPPGAAFQPRLLFLLSTPTLQGAPQIHTRAAPAVLRCYSHAPLGCIWTRDGEMAALRAGRDRAGTRRAGRAGGGDWRGRSRDEGRGFLPFPLPEPGWLKSAFVDGAAESASPSASPASARDSRLVKSSRRMAIVLRAAPATPTLFLAAALIPAQLR